MMIAACVYLLLHIDDFDADQMHHLHAQVVLRNVHKKHHQSICNSLCDRSLSLVVE